MLIFEGVPKTAIFKRRYIFQARHFSVSSGWISGGVPISNSTVPTPNFPGPAPFQDKPVTKDGMRKLFVKYPQ